MFLAVFDKHINSFAKFSTYKSVLHDNYSKDREMWNEKNM